MRAIVKDSPIICLDKPTVNLDKAAKIELIENLIMYSSEKTVLMIIHNLEILKYFDLVFFLQIIHYNRLVNLTIYITIIKVLRNIICH